jgi:hypothetical protein
MLLLFLGGVQRQALSVHNWGHPLVVARLKLNCDAFVCREGGAGFARFVLLLLLFVFVVL